MKMKILGSLAVFLALAPVALAISTSLQIAPSQNEVTVSWSDPLAYLETTYDPAGPWFPCRPAAPTPSV